MGDEDALRVLLVEDNDGDARLIEAYLDRIDPALVPAEVDLTRVGTLSAAFDCVAGDDPETPGPDLLLLDLGLPESTGVDTLDRAFDRIESVPVVVLTGLDDTDTAVEAIQAGAQDYLNKDELDEETFGRTVRYAIERKKRERELRERTQQLEVLTRIMRHDIRNDVTIIRGLAEQVRETESLSDEGREYLQRVVDASTHVTELIASARDFVDSIVGESNPDPVPVSLATILSEELEKAETSYDDAVFAVEGEIPRVAVLADEMLSSVFRNLLNNAVQHNDRETPRITVSTTQSGGTVAVRIADNGPGIPDTREADIFGQGEKGLASEGTGIGLYLVSTLVDRYGGDVRVEDNDPRGAVFVIELQTA